MYEIKNCYNLEEWAEKKKQPCKWHCQRYGSWDNEQSTKIPAREKKLISF